LQVRGAHILPPHTHVVLRSATGDQKQEMPKSASVELQARFLSALLQEREVQPRAFLLAHQITEILPGAAAVVYLLEEEHEGSMQWSPKAVAGDIHLDDAVIPLESGTLGLVAKQNQPTLCPGQLWFAKTTLTCMRGARSYRWHMFR